MSRRWADGLRGVFYGLIVVVLYVPMKALFRLRVHGLHHVAKREPYILVARHRSYWDALLMAVALGARRRIHFIARRGLMRKVAPVQALIRAFSTIIDRENFGRSDFRKMLEAMRRERLIGLFPEGTTRERADAKAGAVRFAMLTGKKLLPVNIRARGPYPPRYPLAWPKVTVSIGRATAAEDLMVGAPEGIDRAELSRWMSSRLMAQVDNA